MSHYSEIQALGSSERSRELGAGVGREQLQADLRQSFSGTRWLGLRFSELIFCHFDA